MTFSEEWISHYDSSIVSRGTYPHFEKLVSMFVVEAKDMLELGVGGAGEIPFFHACGFGYHGVDGSDKAVIDARETFQEVAENIKTCDFTKEIPFDKQFDLIVDRASIPHNDLRAIKSALNLVYEKLKPGGLFILSDWFSSVHSECGSGEYVEPYTSTNYSDGQFKGVGRVHFFTEAELTYLLCKFEMIFMQERVTVRCRPNHLMPTIVDFRWISKRFQNKDYKSAVWDAVLRKPTE